jgi:heme/copper-type cytochrome/quinol oxidase subunit 2
MKNVTKWMTALSATAMLTGTLASGIPAFAHAKPATKKATASVVTVTTSIFTGKMDHKPGWPKYTPSVFHVVAGKTIKLIIKSYDDGNAPITPSYTKVQNTIGGVEWVDGKKFSSFKAADVAHTMTIMEGIKTINIVVPVRTAKEKFVTVTAEFTFPKAGTYTWQCEAACGTGKSGWMGPMMTNGFMKGTWIVSK